jgi:hypothetical protein
MLKTAKGASTDTVINELAASLPALAGATTEKP